MCVLSIKVPIRKKSGNLFNDPRNPQQRVQLADFLNRELLKGDIVNHKKKLELGSKK